MLYCTATLRCKAGAECKHDHAPQEEQQVAADQLNLLVRLADAWVLKMMKQY